MKTLCCFVECNNYTFYPIYYAQMMTPMTCKMRSFRILEKSTWRDGERETKNERERERVAIDFMMLLQYHDAMCMFLSFYMYFSMESDIFTACLFVFNNVMI